MKWKDLIELRYQVISNLGADACEEIIKLFRENNGKPLPDGSPYGYYEAVIEYHDKNYPEWRDEK